MILYGSGTPCHVISKDHPELHTELLDGLFLMDKSICYSSPAICSFNLFADA